MEYLGVNINTMWGSPFRDHETHFFKDKIKRCWVIQKPVKENRWIVGIADKVRRRDEIYHLEYNEEKGYRVLAALDTDPMDEALADPAAFFARYDVSGVMPAHEKPGQPPRMVARISKDQAIVRYEGNLLEAKTEDGYLWLRKNMELPKFVKTTMEAEELTTDVIARIPSCL